jgi:DNA (cytosine-5)-methyltransferase 1
VEIDDWCRAVLAKHWPAVPKMADVRKFPGMVVGEPVDLIAGGFPCQPVSLAGRRRGQDDERWLWPEFARVIRQLRPRLALVENVPGILARGMGDVLGDLAACGYDAEWDCIPAAAFGAPHLRYRVFIVAYAKDTYGWQNGDESARRLAWQLGRGSGPSRPLSDWWATEPDVGRVAHGIPRRVDRLRGLGNAVVPQVAEWIGRRLMEVAI